MLKEDNQKIISFSLFGNKDIYLIGALENAALVDSIYPGWVARFYVDDTVPKEVIYNLREYRAEIKEIESNGYGSFFGTYWRFFVAADTSVERFLIRDADSRINHREAAAVGEWIKSGKEFHLMRDSIAHNKRILGGMWGGVGGSIPDIEGIIKQFGKFNKYGDDEEFLQEIVFPRMNGRYLCHDDINAFGDAKAFPAHEKMFGTSFVGEIVNFKPDEVDIWRELGIARDRAEKLARQAADTIDGFHLPASENWRRAVRRTGKVSRRWGDFLMTCFLLSCLLIPFGQARLRNKRILLSLFKGRI